MPMKIFRTSDNRIIQLATPEMMKHWSPEMPLIYIGYIREKRLQTYGSKKDRKAIEDYLDELMENVAIPKLIEGLDSSDEERIISVLRNIEELSRKKADLIAITIPHVEKKTSHKNKEISSIAKKIINNYERYKKKKQLDRKLSKLPPEKELRKKLLNGEITPEEFGKLMKERLTILGELGEET